MDAKTHSKTVIFKKTIFKKTIFKKTSAVSDSKPGGRDVAKDMVEAGDMRLPVKVFLDHGFPRGDRPTVTGGAVAHPGGAHEKQCYADI